MDRYKSLSGRQLILDSYDQLLQAWGVDVAECDIHTSYGQTHIITAGDPQHPPLMLFHGTADNSAIRKPSKG